MTKRVSGASEQMNERASGPVITSRFLFVPDHSAASPRIFQAHFGSKQPDFPAPSHPLSNEEVSEQASERMSAVSRAEQANE